VSNFHIFCIQNEQTKNLFLIKICIASQVLMAFIVNMISKLGNSMHKIEISHSQQI